MHTVTRSIPWRGSETKGGCFTPDNWGRRVPPPPLSTLVVDLYPTPVIGPDVGCQVGQDRDRDSGWGKEVGSQEGDAGRVS